MRTLIRLLLRFKTLFYFLLLEVFSLLLIVNHNQFQRVRFLNSSNAVTGSIYKTADGVYQYFSLGEVNENLAKENALLRQKVSQLEAQVEFFQHDTAYQGRLAIAHEKNYRFITSKVIQASVTNQKNMLTIDKGAEDSVEVGMGVINDQGVVGIVNCVSTHFATVIPILNSATRSHISAKVNGKSQSGSLFWEGNDMRFATMDEVPLYVPIEVGDTIMTNGYSTSFPEGIMIGTIESFESKNDNFYLINVRLSVNFNRLAYVNVINYPLNNEKAELEGKQQ